ncbi:MAG: hypothetical protein ACI4J0_01655 [Huintestinicola sp.]|uniref:hypothetical protein n=1 Tax=Huintestinicola sp. TaxID=2981661 RepID=UPI003EFEEA5A
MKKRKTLQIIAIILFALFFMPLPIKAPHSWVYKKYAHVSDNFGSDTAEKVLGKKFGFSAETMNAENSEKLRSAIHDIRINNSRIALPLMICDLPEGFSVIYGDEYKLDGYDFSMFTGVLAFGESELGDVYIAHRRGVSEEEGVIIGMMISSGICKWSLGEAKNSNLKTLENAFGKPSETDTNLSDIGTTYFYVTDSGEMAVFDPKINRVFIFALNCTELEANKALCEYVPYDDFEGMTDLPPLAGEKAEFDEAAAFSEKGIVIGYFSCPANITVGELENTDISLVYCETMPYEGVNVHNPDSLIHDCYLVLYKGRYVGVCQSVRQEEESAENAPICFWRILDRESLPCDVSIVGIPASQTNESLEQCLSSDFGDEESGKLWAEGLYEADGELYYVGYIRSSSGYSSLLTDKY